MSEATSHGRASPFNATPLRTGLRARIAWICHALRLAAVIWVVWQFVFVVIHWSDKAAVLQNYERLFSTVLVVSTARYALAFGVVMVAMAAIVVIAFCLWRLAGTYLAGRVFTVDAALWLRRTGIGSRRTHRQRDRSRRSREHSDGSLGADVAARLLLHPAAGCPSPDLRHFRLSARPHLQGGGRDGR